MFFSYPFQMPLFIIVCMIKSQFGSVLQYCTCTRLSCNKTLQWKSGYYTESKTEASKCCQVVISAVVLKNVTLKTKIQFGSKQRKNNNTHCPNGIAFVMSCVRGTDATVSTLGEASEGGVPCYCKHSTDEQRRTHWHVGDLSPFGQSGLLQWTVDKEAVVVANKSWGEQQGQRIRV